MPSASTSTLSMPSASISSLSQEMTVRSSIEAFSMGTSSSRRPRAMRKPPGCCERWRGKPISSRVSSMHSASRRSARVEAKLPEFFGVDAFLAPARDRAGQRGRHIGRKAQRLAHLAHRAARAVANHGGA